MKKIFYAGALALVLTGCANAQKEEIAIQKEVLSIHDKIMEEDQKVMHNKMKIDTLLQQADSLKINKQEAMDCSKLLTQASDQMSSWMEKLNLDNGGKNHDGIMQYWNTQKAAGKHIDSLYDTALDKSNAYLQKTLHK